MNIKTDMPSAEVNGDLVLQEVWSAKETLSAAYGHDLERWLKKPGNTKSYPVTRW